MVWPFGYGLDYSRSWTLKWGSKMPKKSVPASQLLGGVEFEVSVSNGGSVAGSKVVQLYISTPELTNAPRRSLVAMAKVHAGAGGSASVVLNTAAVKGTCAFCVYDEQGKSSVPKGTRYDVSVGDGGGDYFPAFSVVSS